MLMNCTSKQMYINTFWQIQVVKVHLISTNNSNSKISLKTIYMIYLNIQLSQVMAGKGRIYLKLYNLFKVVITNIAYC